jgi:hypothetical protein
MKEDKLYVNVEERTKKQNTCQERKTGIRNKYKRGNKNIRVLMKTKERSSIALEEEINIGCLLVLNEKSQYSQNK